MMARRVLEFARALVCWLAIVPLLAAQQTPTPTAPDAAATPATVQVETLRQLVTDIDDPERREQLLQRLRALIDVAQAPTGDDAAAGAGSTGAIERLVAFFHRLGDEAAHTVANVVDQIARVPERLRAFTARMSDPPQRAEFLDQAVRASGILLAALLVHVLAWFLVQRPRRLLGRTRDNEPPLGALARGWRVAVRLMLDLAPPVAAVAVALLGLSIVRVSTSGAAIALAVVTATALRSALRAALHAVLAPNTANLRLIPVGTDATAALAGSLRRAGAALIYGWFAVVMVRAVGSDPELVAALTSLYSLTLLATGTVLVLRYRNWPGAFEPAPATTAESSTGTSRAGPARASSVARAVARTAARFWWLVALVYMFGLYALWISGTAGAFLTALEATVLSIASAAIAFVSYVFASAALDKLGARMVAAAKALPTIRRRIPSYLAGARLVIGIALGVTAAGFAFEAWGLETLSSVQSTFVRTVVTSALGVLAVLFLAFLTIDIMTAVTDTYLSRKQQLSQDSAKLRTLVPLAQKAVRVVVWTIAGLTMLGQLGISLGPILASIGVLGLAVGFGAQTLVKDVITGVFILLEDAVSVGDVVMIDGTGGVVEAINIRTIRLRDLSGNVHTIPYSTVGKLTNMTKDFSYYLIECGVAYRENVDEVIEMLKELGAEMQRDETFGPNILEPIEILGLDRFEDSAVIVRARLKTRPAKQWASGREFNRRMKRAFDERGIEIPFPHRTIYIGEDKLGHSPPLHIAARSGGLADLAADRGGQPSGA